MIVRLHPADRHTHHPAPADMACTALASSSALAGLQQRRAIPASSSPAGSGAVLPRRHRCTAAAAATPLGLLAELPAQASEAFIDTTAGIPDVGQAAADAAADAAAAQAAAAAEAFAAAQQAAGSDPSELVFTALFGVASEHLLDCLFILLVHHVCGILRKGLMHSCSSSECCAYPTAASVSTRW